MVEHQARLKAELRKQMEDVRPGMAEVVRSAKSVQISAHVKTLLDRMAGDVAGSTVMSYVPFRSEVNVRPLIEQLWRGGYRVAAPKVNRENRMMECYVIEGTVDLIPGAWGILEPRADKPRLGLEERIDAVIVPGLAFDREGGRLGYGAGFYDRFFRGLEAVGLPMPVRIGVCYEDQIVPKVPMETHDYAVDWVVTENGASRCAAVKSS